MLASGEGQPLAPHSPTGDKTHDTRAMSYIRSYDGMYLDVKIAGINISGLIDTGSTATVVHPSVYENIAQEEDCPLKVNLSRLTMADGRDIPILGSIILPICVGQLETFHTVLVVEIDADVVIGCEFWKKNR